MASIAHRVNYVRTNAYIIKRSAILLFVITASICSALKTKPKPHPNLISDSWEKFLGGHLLAYNHVDALQAVM